LQLQDSSLIKTVAKNVNSFQDCISMYITTVALNQAVLFIHSATPSLLIYVTTDYASWSS